ncbi:hypothetical protein D3C85_1769130 [compost metagenome]
MIRFGRPMLARPGLSRPYSFSSWYTPELTFSSAQSVALYAETPSKAVVKSIQHLTRNPANPP